MDVFLLHGSQNYAFLKEIKVEYEEQVVKKMENNTNENNSELKEEEIKEKVNEIFFSKISQEEI